MMAPKKAKAKKKPGPKPRPKKDMRSQTIASNLTPEQYDWVAKRAEELDVSHAWYIRHLVILDMEANNPVQHHHV